jgi:hypothetical protein
MYWGDRILNYVEVTGFPRSLFIADDGRAVGTWIVWLDQVLPMYRRDAFSIEAAIGMVKSTNHRFRMITIFRRL